MKTDKRNQEKKVLALAVIALLLAACGTDEKTARQTVEQAIRPPMTALEPAFSDYTLNASEGDTFVAPSGTRIIVPPQALADTSGKPVTGDVKLRYREYSDAVDIFLSGIPMEYNGSDGKHTFQTAGMFEIRAELKGQPLQIAQGKNIEVALASNVDGADYNMYRFDEGKQAWETIGYTPPQPNAEKKELGKKMAAMEQKLGKQRVKDCFIMNYGSLMDVYFGFNEALAFKNFYNKALRKKMEKYGLTIYDFKMWDYIAYRGREYPAQLMVWKYLSGEGLASLKKHNFNPDKITRERGDVYTLTGKRWFVKKYRGKGKLRCEKISIRVRCVMPIKDYIKLPTKNELEQYKIELTELQRQYALEAEVYRAIRISGLGIYNFDRFLPTPPDAIATRVQFRIKGGESINSRPQVFCFTGDNRSVFTIFDNGGKNMLDLNPQDTLFQLVMVLDGKRLAVFKAEQYRAIDFGRLKKMPVPSYTFVLQADGREISSEEDVRKLLNI